ncbi:MAG: hypothetical protein LC708_03340, partial [Actinobacteria bacterium]|nr:hypothetical protein [Actinomycetota bacterium]
ARPLGGGPPPVAGSGPFTPTTPGTYRWIAVYSGDANYPPVTSACNAPNETSVVPPPAATMTTQATPSAPFGGAISDSATVAGAGAPAPAPTGTVTFRVFGPNDPNCAGVPAFDSGPQALTGGVPATASSGTFSPAAPGVYRWVATYSGDANYAPVAGGCNAPNETSVVNSASATLSTQAFGPVTLGSPVSDAATVTGLAAPAPAPTGTVTFTAFGPDDATCAGPAAFSSGAQPLGGGPPPQASSGDFVPVAPGLYRWVASYSGDASYAPVTSACNDANESSLVTQALVAIATQATATGTIGGPISDTATVTGAPAPAPAPTGTVTFTVFGPDDPSCSGGGSRSTAATPTTHR